MQITEKRNIVAEDIDLLVTINLSLLSADLLC